MSGFELPINEIICGDNIATLERLPDASIDACVNDPPYGLRFMGKAWDYDVPSVDVWREVLRVLKPGGHLLAFAGTRTQHRMALRIEEAGFEIRDMIAWVYGSGFPKSMDVSKAIDKAAGHWRGKAGEVVSNNGAMSSGNYKRTPKGDPITAAAVGWQGWGTALKPALEPITVARKPLAGTVAANVLEHGTGALNVDGCRVGTDGGTTRSEQAPYAESGWRTGHEITPLNAGRWPANLIHDGGNEAIKLLEDAARFFYTAKADQSERRNSRHPTIKPVALMRYLVRLVTPMGGIVLDPFGGSGTTAEAARMEHVRFILIEQSAEYCQDASERLRQGVLF